MDSKWLSVTIGLALGVVLAVAGTAMGQLESKRDGHSLNLTRACFPKIGQVAVTMAATTSSDADSGALNDDSMYMMRCDTAAWVRFGSSAVNAAADDWLCEPGEVYFIPTGGDQSLLHISAKSKSVDGDVRLIECK